MAGHKLLKRKGGVVDQIADDFSDFSLSSPATKIRRLDAALPPIVEEEDKPVTASTVPNNDERALVLFKPLHRHHHSPSSFSLTLNSDLISELKHQQLPWSKQRDDSSFCDYDLLNEIEEEQNDNNNGRLAIVPWVPQQQQPSPSSISPFDDNNNTELMEADDDNEIGGEEEMDVEEQQHSETVTTNSSSAASVNNPTLLNLHHQVGVAEGFQQHCLLPHIPQNTSTPITWTR